MTSYGDENETTPIPPGEWDPESAPTTVTAPPLDAIPEGPPEPMHEEVTKPNDLVPVLAEARAAGRAEGKELGVRTGFEEGQEDVLSALTSLMFEDGASNREVAYLMDKLRPKLTKL